MGVQKIRKQLHDSKAATEDFRYEEDPYRNLQSSYKEDTAGRCGNKEERVRPSSSISNFGVSLEILISPISNLLSPSACAALVVQGGKSARVGK